ncbi:MAG TPA: DUF554 domain-containing protein [Anaeromyxobacter sp.]|nr:DUF554 domain-containing protein [Anaeromyxobacter sp.]
MLELLARTSGTWVNVSAIAAGTAVGVVAGGRLPERLSRTLMQVLGLVTLYVGLGMARGLESVQAGPLPGIILALVSLAAGAVVGEVAGVEERLALLGEALRRRVRGGGRFTDGFVAASLLFCIGPMAIVGSLQNGLTLDARTLVLKSALDGIAAVALGGVYGVGVGFSALPILALQGGLSVTAAALSRALPDPMTDPRVLAVSGAGGLLVAAIGLNLVLAGLGLEERRLRVGAMLPALVIAPALCQLAGMLGR